MPSQESDLRRFSRYLDRQLNIHPQLADELSTAAPWPITADELARWQAEITQAGDQLKPGLRQIKRRALMRIAARDLLFAAPLAEVLTSISTTAVYCIRQALDVLSTEQAALYGIPRDSAGNRQELIVIGMGKLGGGELNISSDIDLIFVYPEEGQTDGVRPISNAEFFTRLGRKLINALADLTEDGYVFRVDMRLRPYGDSGPLVCSFAMLEEYFITQGREWERYAWIKALPLTGSQHEALEAIRRPFVFRKYLDFGAIDAMRGLHAQIRREVAKKDMAANIKLGPGGIREIEFIAQVFQLIRGGRDQALRNRSTVHTLAYLGQSRQMEPKAATALTAAYDFLRRLEHRLQYLDDAQTQTMPDTAHDLTIIAQAMHTNPDHATTEWLLAQLEQQRSTVTTHFEQVFAGPTPQTSTPCDTPPEACFISEQLQEVVAQLTALGYSDPQATAQRLQNLRASPRIRQMSDKARQRLETLLPRTLRVCAEHSPGDAALVRCLDLFEAVAQRSAYLALLLEYPQALAHLAHIVGSSTWAAEYLRLHPVLLDELLDARLLTETPDWSGFQRDLEARLDEYAMDTERQMDLMREAQHAQVFRLLAQDVSGSLALETLSDHLSALADLLLQSTLTRVWQQMAQRHQETPDFAIISYGKLGGKELGYASDLDVIFLFDDPHPDAAQIYARLATRINTWLSSRTAAGLLYETDLRLRPNGDSGLVVTSFAAFRKYQEESAWIWEHQALTRARFSAGNARLGATFETLRQQLLCLPRDPTKLRQEVLAMREKMRTAHARRSAGFDLKHDPGGLIDVEFLVQYLILAHAAQTPDLVRNLGNIALLRLAATHGLIPADHAAATADAYRHFRRLQHSCRLNRQEGQVAPDRVATEVEAVRALWHIVFGSTA